MWLLLLSQLINSSARSLNVIQKKRTERSIPILITMTNLNSLFPIRNTNNMIGLEPHFGVIWITGLFRPLSYSTVFTLFIRKRLLFAKVIIFYFSSFFEKRDLVWTMVRIFKILGQFWKGLYIAWAYSFGILKTFFTAYFFPPLRGVV